MATFRYLTLFPVFAIQKCDPAPFYLFDEVR
jgi:chromosome segregation ATPase